MILLCLVHCWTWNKEFQVLLEVRLDVFQIYFRKLKIGFKMNIEALKCYDLCGLFFPNEDRFSCSWQCWFACKFFFFFFWELVPHWAISVREMLLTTKVRNIKWPTLKTCIKVPRNPLSRLCINIYAYSYTLSRQLMNKSPWI